MAQVQIRVYARLPTRCSVPTGGSSRPTFALARFGGQARGSSRHAVQGYTSPLTPTTYALVVLSAAAHAYWNFLLKKSGGTQVFTGLSKIAEAAAFVVLLAAGLIDRSHLADAWVLPVVGALLVIINYVLLTLAYRHGDLSFVYPISRGAVLVFLPPLAYFFTGERLDVLGWAALAIIVFGIVCVQVQRFAAAPHKGVPYAASIFALLAAAVAAGYTVWDKRAVQTLAPTGYFAAYTVLVGLAYTAYLLRAIPATEIKNTWRDHRSAIVQVAVLNSGSYLLALIALQTGKASYVIALRQLSIAAGALLGWLVLGESLPSSRRFGIGLVVAGAVLLALAR
jgi:drug/metabolite transporter (DMT)-like permease